MITNQLAAITTTCHEKCNSHSDSASTNPSKTDSNPTTHTQSNTKFQEEIHHQMVGLNAIEAMITDELATIKTPHHQKPKIRADSSKDSFSARLMKLRQQLASSPKWNQAVLVKEKVRFGDLPYEECQLGGSIRYSESSPASFENEAPLDAGV